MEQYVCRLKISVKNVLIIQFTEGTLQLCKDFHGFFFCQFSFLFDVFSQSTSIAVLIDQVVVVGSSEHFNEFDDVRMVDFGQDCDLIVGELTQFGCMFKLLNVHNFDCIMLVRLPIVCFIHITILSLPYFLQKDIIFDDFVH